MDGLDSESEPEGVDPGFVPGPAIELVGPVEPVEPVEPDVVLVDPEDASP